MRRIWIFARFVKPSLTGIVSVGFGDYQRVTCRTLKSPSTLGIYDRYIPAAFFELPSIRISDCHAEGNEVADLRAA